MELIFQHRSEAIDSCCHTSTSVAAVPDPTPLIFYVLSKFRHELCAYKKLAQEDGEVIHFTFRLSSICIPRVCEILGHVRIIAHEGMQV